MGGDLGVRRAAVVVGRDTECDALRDAVRVAHCGRSACVFVRGEAGIGKTRLLNEAANLGSAFDAAVLTGRAPITAPAPFSVIADALRSWLRTHPVADPLTPFDRGLGVVLPEWPVTAPASDLDAGQRQLLALEAVIQLLRTLIATADGAVLIVDDLHFADPDSLETIRYVAAARIDGLAIVGALRPTESRDADDLVARLSRDGVASVVDLAPLDERAVDDLVAALLETRPPSPLVADILARTDGVPLLVEEVLRGHVVAGTVRIDDDGARWEGGVARVPPTIRDLVDARLSTLAPRDRNVVVAGAVLGDFDAGLVRGLADAGDVDVAIALEAGVRTSLLETVAGTITFRHEIIREAVLEATVPHVVDSMHRRAAVALAADADRRGPDALERSARHLAAVGAADDAAGALTAAADRWRENHALLAAERAARAACEQARTAPVRATASDALARALAAQGRWTEAFELDEATVAEHGDTPERRLRRATCALDLGRPEVADSIVATMLDVDGDTPDVALVAGRAALVRGDAEQALHRAREVVGNEDVAIDGRLSALDLEGRAFDFLGDRDAARASWTRQAQEAERAGRTQARLRAVVQLGKVELFAGEPPERLFEAVELAEEAGALVELGWAQENLGIALAIRGRLVEAAAVFDDAVARFSHLQLDQLAYLLAARAMARTFIDGPDLDDIDAAEKILPTPDLLLHTTSMRGDIAMRDRRYDDAVREFARSTELAQSMPGVVPMDSVCWLPIALLAAGRRNDAVAALEEARATPDLERFFSRPVIAAAAAALVAGDAAAFDAALDAAPNPMSTDVALLHVMAAELIGGDDRARWLRAALDTYDTFGAAHESDRVRGLLRDAGGVVPRRKRAASPVAAELATAGVTAREAEVLRLIGDGLPNAEIATRLYVSVRTVEAHVSSLLRKLQARNRSELAVRSAAIDWSS